METREMILNTAFLGFLEEGFDAVSLNEIIKRTGLTKGAFYYYFKSKEELIAEMILLKINEFEVQLKKVVDEAGDVRDKLKTYMKMKISIMRENMPFIKLFDKEHLPLKAKEFLHTHKKRLLETDFCMIKDILQQGIKNHNVSFKLNDSLVLMILGVTYGAFVGRFLENTNWDIDEMIDTSIEVIFKGIE